MATRPPRATPAVVAICVGLVGNAVVFTTWTGDAFGLPKLTVVALSLIAAATLLVVSPERLTREAPRWPPLARPVAALVAVMIVTAVTSSSRADSFFGRYERYNGVVPVLLYAALAFVVYRLGVARRDRLHLVAAAILSGAALAALYVLVQVAGLDPLDWREPSGAEVAYQAGTLGNSNFAGAYLGIALAFVPVLWRTTAGGWRVAMVAAGAVTAGGTVATQSRGGILAGATAVATLALVHAVPVLRAWPRPRRLALIVATGMLVVVTLAVGASTSVTRTESLTIRIRQWRAATSMAIDHPIVGTGPDTFQLHYPAYRGVDDARELGLQLADKPHNLVLEHAQGSGALGVIAYVALVAAAAALAIRSLRRLAPGDERRWLISAFAAAAAAHVAQGVFSIDVPPLAVLWWVVLGGLAGAAAGIEGVVRAGRPTTSTAPTATVAAAVVVALLAAWVATRPWRADWATADGRHDAAVALHPFQAVFHLNRGAAASGDVARASRRDDAIRALRAGEEAFADARRLQPRGVFAAVGEARLLRLAAIRLDPTRFGAADAAYERALALDPRDWEVMSERATLLADWADTTGDESTGRRAIAAYQRALAIREDDIDSWVGLARVARDLGDDDLASMARARAEQIDPDAPALEWLDSRDAPQRPGEAPALPG